MATASRAIEFIVPEQGNAKAAPPVLASRGRVAASIKVGATRDGAAPVRVSAIPGEDVVVLEIANGPTLVLHPEDARDLMLVQSGEATRSATPRGNAVAVPTQLGWPGLEAAATSSTTRGFLGTVLLSGLHVITGLGKDPADLVTAAVTLKVDGQVEPGVYPLRLEGLGPRTGGGVKVPAAADGGPILVLVHGTFSSTTGTFKQLWDLHGDVLGDLFTAYGGRVYGFDHPTLGESPIANALMLARALPAGARVHLLTHSRGGLVAELLARACAGTGVDDVSLARFDADGYKQHLKDLRALVAEARRKGLRVERTVRVACPARGTLLASKRLDAYLSVLTWCLQLANVPVLPQLVDFLHEVARRRAQPEELPGLEAMTPGSPVVAWINDAGDAIPGDLRVVAGDIQGDSIVSWTKTLLSDAFFWTDNDLVVQTRSMYGGTPRAAGAEQNGAMFLLDRSAKVSHFNYFANEGTVKAIAAALRETQPDDFAAIGPLSWSGKDASGTRAALAVARSRGAGDASAADKPAVFVIPGILGSNLALDKERIWLGFRFVNGLEKLAWDPKTAARVTPDGPIGNVYGDLIERLADTYEVIPFAFDWRRPIEDEARRLGEAVEAALTVRAGTGRPVRIVAHSMGGLVARTMAIFKPDTWQRMLAVDGARVLMLGTPNGGSWSPMQTLSGDDTFGNALASFGALFDNRGARKTMAGMPGFLQLQAALLDPKLALDRCETWQDLADRDLKFLLDKSIWHVEGVQKAIYQWGAPAQGVLDQAVDLRRKLDAQAAALGADATKMLLVVGRAPFTPGGWAFGDAGLEYVDAEGGGDGRVPLSSAILPGVKTWRVEAAHGDLPSTANAFPAYLELLAKGDTRLIDPLESDAMTGPATTGRRSRPSRGLESPEPPSGARDVFGAPKALRDDARRPRGKAAALRVGVFNGDLKFIRQPLLIGHYHAQRLTGTEAVVDGLVDRAMSRWLNAGLYPDETGSHQIFDNDREDAESFDMARPIAVIVVGLGEEGKLRAAELSRSVRQGILAYAQRLAEHQPDATEFELAATLVGSGGSGVSVGASAQHLMQGAIDANAVLQANQWPRISQLTLVELYLERAGDAWRALRLAEAAAPADLQVVGKITFGPGALRRSLESNYRGADYDFISATQVQGKDNSRCISYTLDTSRARTEVRALHAQGTLLRELVLKASNDKNQDRRIGRTLFNLLIPVEMEPFLAGTSSMCIEVDTDTAAIPWELLDTRSDARADAEELPWSIRSKLLRKLRLDDFRAVVNDAGHDDSVLVIGEPKVDPTCYPALPAARAEALAVAAKLTEPASGLGPEQVRSLTSGEDDAQTVINALFERPWRAVHIAGHGYGGSDGGVVLSGESTYLGANEVRAMRIVPELVFLNCCHLAGRDASSLLAPTSYDRAAFAANIAEELIKVGVRCVIAAGWAVEDVPAAEFATAFYATLLRGERFINAVGAARTAAYRANPLGNTWAAYQCYGDPEWTWQRGGGAQTPVSLADRFGQIASPIALALALENLAIGSEYGGATRQSQLDKVRWLDNQFTSLWGAMGAVAEAFGAAYAAVNEVDKAIGWYGIAVNAEDGSASFKAVEQLGNQLVRRGERSEAAAAEARADIEAGIAQLVSLALIKSTPERLSLLGSAYKRLTMFEARAGTIAAAKKAVASAIQYYADAETEMRRNGGGNIFYPAKNRLSCEWWRALHGGPAVADAGDRLAEIRRLVDAAAAANADFWSVVGPSEVSLLEALIFGRLSLGTADLIAHLQKLKARVPSTQKWDSVWKEAQFTVGAYKAKASAAEQRAAAHLLAALEAMAKP